MAQTLPAGAEPVIPPHQEALLGRMLGVGTVQFPGGCSFGHADIQMTVVKATYICGQDKFVIELRHPSAAAPTALRTHAFALVPVGHEAPQALLDALAERIRGLDADWKWSAETKSTSNFLALLPTRGAVPAGTRTDGPALTSAQLAEWSAVVHDLAQSPYQALDGALKLARENPYRGVLGLVAAAVVGFDNLNQAQAEAIRSAADKNPRDPASQFAAGVAMQARADKDGAADQHRYEEGAAALSCFDRALPAYDGVAELHLYRAISLFRFGRDSEAESDVARAMALAPTLPDPYYARAEIQQARLPAALADLAEYVKRMQALPTSPFTQEMVGTARNASLRLQGRPLIAYPSVRKHEQPGLRHHRRLSIVLSVLLLGLAALILRSIRHRRVAA